MACKHKHRTVKALERCEAKSRRLWDLYLGTILEQGQGHATDSDVMAARGRLRQAQGYKSGLARTRG